MRFIGAGLVVIIFVFLSTLAYAQRAQIKVIILPFDMYSKEDITDLRRHVMEAVAGSLDSAGAEIVGMEEIKRLVLEEGVERFDESVALKIAEGVRADFAILGSVSRLGRYIEVDYRILDIREGTLFAFYSRRATTDKVLLRRIEKIAKDVLERMSLQLKVRPAVKEGIVDVITIVGNRRVDSEAIRRKLVSKAGEPFSPDKVKEDIRNIYGMGYFEDIMVDLSDSASGKELTYIVKEKPFVKKIELSGNEEVSSEKINGVLTVKENTVLDMVLLNENAEKIKALYAEEGFYLAEVTPEVLSDGVEASVIFRIKEGQQVRVKRITIIGNKVFTDREIKKIMNTEEAGFFSFITGSGKFNEFLFNNDLALIMSHYFDNGYIEADILDYRVLLSEDKKWFYITIALTEGEQFRIGDVEVKGDLDIVGGEDEIRKALKIEKGEIFNRTKLTRGIEAVSDLYRDKGYANVDVAPLTRVDRKERVINLVIDIKKNELVYIERIDITGNVRTRDKVIRRELEVSEGELYSSSGIKRSRNNLRRLGYFDDVRISQTQGSRPDRIKLDVEVVERPTGSISAGMGYSSVDKLIGTASISQSNLLGTGIKLNLSGTVSATSSRYVLGFTEPWLFDKPISAGFDIYDMGREYPDFTTNRQGFDIRFGFPIYKRNTYGFVTYTFEEVQITDVSEFASIFIKSQEGETTSSNLRTVIRHDTRDDMFFPTEGVVLIASTEFAGGFLGGESNYIKYEADAVKFFPLPYDTTFSVRGSVGYVTGFGGKEAPIYEKYFLGGINSIRGFETRSVSPKDPATDEYIGGDTMLVVNFELLFPLFSEQRIKGLTFFDVGNAYKGPINLGDLRTSAGLGIRWFSPIGPLRLEWGYNLNRRPGEKGHQWEFAVGTAF